MRTMDDLTPRLAHYLHHLDNVNDTIHSGRVSQIVGLTIESIGPTTNIGDLCLISPGVEVEFRGSSGIPGSKVLLMPLSDLTGVGPGVW